MVEYVVAAVILLVVLIVGAVGLVVPKMRRRDLPPPPTAGSTTTLERPPVTPPVPVEEELPPLIERPEPAAPVVVEEPPAPVVEEKPALEKPEPSAGRLVRLRARLARSQSALGRGLLSVLSRDHLEEEDWEEIEESLITADVGIEATQVIVERLRERVRVLGTKTVAEVRAQLVEELVAALEPDMDRSLKTARHDGRPAVVLVVGVNGAGKTTTCGKIGRVLSGSAPRPSVARRVEIRPAWRSTR
jgi:fused signal recognition particle receptor